VPALVSVFCGGATGVLLSAGGPSLLLGGVATPEGCSVPLVAGVSFAGGAVVGAGCATVSPE
jgi:hypothetical protein